MEWRPLTEVLPALEQPPLHVFDRAASSAEPLFTPSRSGRDGASTSGHGGDADDGQAPGAPSPGELRAAREAEAEAVRQAAYEEGTSLARREGEALAARYRTAIEELALAREQVIRGAEADLVRLALTVAREVLMAEVQGREQFTQQMIGHALGQMNTSQTLTLRLCPQDLHQLRQSKPELMRRPGLSVVEDPTLAMGGVVAEGEMGRMDASVSGRLDAMAQTLLGGAP